MKLPQGPTFSICAGKSQTGWTLLEMMITMAISSLVLLAVMQTTIFTARGFAALGNYADLDRASRNTLDQMSRDIRQAKVFGYGTANRLYFTNMDNSWFSYHWDPNTKVVSRLSGVFKVSGSRSNLMLSGCDFFSFNIFLRNPTNGFWFPYSALGQEENTKLVDVSWRCKRRVINLFNTESVQTAKIVLRN